MVEALVKAVFRVWATQKVTWQCSHVKPYEKVLACYENLLPEECSLVTKKLGAAASTGADKGPVGGQSTGAARANSEGSRPGAVDRGGHAAP